MFKLKELRGYSACATAAATLLAIAPWATAQSADERFSGIAAVSDVDGNGYGDHAVVKWHPGKKEYFVYITDGSSGNYIDKYAFGSVPVQGILGIEDVNGNEQREVAILRVNRKGRSFVRVRDAASGEDLSDSYVAGGVQKPKAMATVSDISGNDAPEYAVLFTNKNTTASLTFEAVATPQP